MPIVNDKLGNGFVIRSTDSILDQEHHFGAKKHLKTVAQGVLTGSFQRCYASGSHDVRYSWQLNDVLEIDENTFYACGFKHTGSTTSFAYLHTRWTILRSKDGGDSWQEVDDFAGQEPPGPHGRDRCEALGMASSGSAVFVIGMIDDGTDNQGGHWFIRSSSDGGDSWGTTYESPSTIGFTPVGSSADYWNRVGAVITTLNNGHLLVSHSVVSTSGTILTSSDGTPGSWGEVGTLNTIGTNDEIPTAVMTMGDKILWGVRRDDVMHQQVVSGTQFGNYAETVLYDDNAAASSGLRSILKFLSSSTGKIWAVGEEAVRAQFFSLPSINGGYILTSSTGDSGSWGFYTDFTSRFFREPYVISDIIEDNEGYIWISSYKSYHRTSFLDQGLSAVISYITASEVGEFTDLYFPEHSYHSFITGSKYHNIIAVGVTGTNGGNGNGRERSEGGTIIDKIYPQSLRSQGSSSVVAELPVQLYMGFNIFDSETRSSIDKQQRGSLFLGLGGHIEEIKFLNNSSFSFNFSGSFEPFQEVALSPLRMSGTDSSLNLLTGSQEFFDIRSGSLRIVQNNNSSSFAIQKNIIPNPPNGVAYVRVSLSSSASQESVLFSDFEIQYSQPLTDEGVQFFKNVENQNLEFNNIGFPMSKVVK